MSFEKIVIVGVPCLLASAALTLLAVAYGWKWGGNNDS